MAIIKIIVAAFWTAILPILLGPRSTSVEEAESHIERLDPLPKAERDSNLVGRAPTEWLR